MAAANVPDGRHAEPLRGEVVGAEVLARPGGRPRSLDSTAALPVEAVAGAALCAAAALHDGDARQRGQTDTRRRRWEPDWPRIGASCRCRLASPGTAHRRRDMAVDFQSV